MRRFEKKFKPLLFCVCLISANTKAYAGIEESISNVVSKAKLQSDGVGIVFRQASDGKVLFEKNSALPLNPASTIKVIISAVSLDLLGTNYRFATKVFQRGSDLCLKGGGDPSLVQEKIMLLAEDVMRAGVKKVSGDLILDDTLFKAELPYDESFVGDSDRAFVGQVSPLSANFNAVSIVGMPTVIGQIANVTSDPLFDFIHVKSSAKTAAKASRTDLDADVVASSQGLTIQARGLVGKNDNQTFVYRTVPDPTSYTGHIFQAYFKRAGGSILGGIKKGSCGADAKEVASINSKPLAHIVQDLDKFSNNFIAEMLLRAVSSQGTREAGIAAVQDWLKKNKLELPSLVMENASGLSRKSRISASDLERVVRFSYTHPKIGPEFMSALPIGATDGTMKRRLKNESRASHVRGKSGSLSDTTSLTGVLYSSVYGWVTYAMLFNRQAKANWDLMALEDEILSLFI